MKNLKSFEEIDNSFWITLSNGRKFRIIINGIETTIFKETEKEKEEIEENCSSFEYTLNRGKENVL